MKKHSFILPLLFFCACLISRELVGGGKLCAETVSKEPFVNDIAMPSKLYLLEETQWDMFAQPILKRWRPYNDFVRFSLGKGKFLRRLEKVSSISAPIDGDVLETELINGDEFETIKSIKTTLCVGKKGVGDKKIVVQMIGDSYTLGNFYGDALVKNTYCPNLELVGLRKLSDNNHNEGRGGWALNNYFSIPLGATKSYHGFMHPKGNYRFWGDRAFWINAWKCFNKKAPVSFETNYSCSKFDDFLGKFDEKTGVLLHPETGDLQYDSDTKEWYLYENNAWQNKKELELTWSFDYGKYLKMWNIKTPDFLFVLLGLNDFCNHIHADFQRWEKMITAMKESFYKSNPKGKFVVCIPCSTCGSLDNQEQNFTPMFNAAMWNFRKWLIDTFDNRESEGWYLVDVGICGDNDHGYYQSTDTEVLVPFHKYEGKEQLHVQERTLHPYLSYPCMGVPVAAFIQYHRERVKGE